MKEEAINMLLDGPLPLSVLTWRVAFYCGLVDQVKLPCDKLFDGFLHRRRAYGVHLDVIRLKLCESFRPDVASDNCIDAQFQERTRDMQPHAMRGGGVSPVVVQCDLASVCIHDNEMRRASKSWMHLTIQAA